MKKLIKRVGGNDAKKAAAPAPRAGAGYTPLSQVIFNKYDKDGDGSMTMEEFEQFTKDKGYFFSEEELVTGFAKIDADGSGDITYDEFKTFWQDEDRLMHMKLTPQQTKVIDQVVDMFYYFDADRNGKLDPEEYKNLHIMMVQEGFDMRGNGHEQVYKMIDINGDGTIEFTELLRFLVENFGILDTADSQQ